MRLISACEQNAVGGGLPSVFWGFVTNALYDFVTGTDWRQEIRDAYINHSYGYYGPDGSWLPR